MTTPFPKEWKSVTGSEFVVDPKSDIVDGPFGSNLKSSEYIDSGVPIARIQNVKRFNFIDKNIRFVSEEKAEELQRHSFACGDILITKLGDPLGLACEVPESFEYGIIVADLVRLRPNLGVCFKSYLTYLLNSEIVIKQIELHVKGTTRPRINLGVIRGLSLPLPPLAEQKVIADKLDILLAQVETSKARLERIPEILKTFRQSVLAAAVSGKLTKEWREGNEVSIESWVSTNIGELAQVATDKTPKRTNAEYWDGGNIPWLTSSATGSAFTFEAEQFVTELAVKECTLKLFPIGTLLLAMYGEGKTRGQVTELQLESTCNQACAAILVDETKVSKEFLKLRLQENYEETRKAAVGGAQPNLNLSKVREITVELPSEPEQTEIVRRVKGLFAFIDRIEQSANTALKRVNNLTQAILAKAFRGELTAEWRAVNPELVSGENSAEALLEKIKAEREVLKKQPKLKRTAVKKRTGSIMNKQIIKVVDALKEAGQPLSGQQLLAAAGYPSNSSTDQLEQFFLDIREALTSDKSIIKLERSNNSQDWFALAETAETNKA